MGLYATLMEASPEIWQKIRADPAYYASFDCCWLATLDLDKFWHGLHFLLTGEVSKQSSLLSRAVLGGSLVEKVALDEEERDELVPEELAAFYPPEEDEVLLDYTYVLTPDEVKETAGALTRISQEKLRASYDGAAMLKAEIYPPIWDRAAENVMEELLDYFDKLVSFYSVAARRGSAVFYELA